MLAFYLRFIFLYMKRKKMEYYCIHLHILIFPFAFSKEKEKRIKKNILFMKKFFILNKIRFKWQCFSIFFKCYFTLRFTPISLKYIKLGVQ